MALGLIYGVCPNTNTFMNSYYMCGLLWEIISSKKISILNQHIVTFWKKILQKDLFHNAVWKKLHKCLKQATLWCIKLII